MAFFAQIFWSASFWQSFCGHDNRMEGLLFSQDTQEGSLGILTILKEPSWRLSIARFNLNWRILFLFWKNRSSGDGCHVFYFLLCVRISRFQYYYYNNSCKLGSWITSPQFFSTSFPCREFKYRLTKRSDLRVLFWDKAFLYHNALINLYKKSFAEKETEEESRV